MIVRILGEGQFDVPEGDLDRLNELDDRLVGAIESDDEEGFQSALAELLGVVQSHATPHSAEALDASDLVLPGTDSSLEEVRRLLGEEGLIPG
ncbi:MAG: PspA-associated protein PspAA [Acidimicrobiia bacterium]